MNAGTVNSRLADTPLLQTGAEVLAKMSLLKITRAIMESSYYGHQVLVLMVSVITRVDCSSINLIDRALFFDSVFYQYSGSAFNKENTVLKT